MSELPKPPLRVYAKGHRQRSAEWWTFDEHTGTFVSFTVLEFKQNFPEQLRVIDHPRNDAEAVELIAQSKETRK